MISDRPILFTSNSQSSDDISLLQIINLIADTLGIHIQPQHQTVFKRAILPRIQALGLSSLNDYYQYLTTRNRLDFSAIEWQELIFLLTVTESYFFRDQGQFWLLKNQLLPALIERKRQLHLTHSVKGQRPVLRLWSAGCSTGEEAYSLAVLLKELIPDYQTWDILILGTDINQSAIELAQQGIYSDWSFRTTDPETRNRYFKPHRKGWKIDPSIRAMVSFQPGNLVQDHYPDSPSKIHDLDLILCRNVFIYFDFNAIAQVLEKFYCSLAPGGFLLTGHTELHGQKTEPFQVKSFPQSVVYQRSSPFTEQVRLAYTTYPNRPHLQPFSLTEKGFDLINSLSQRERERANTQPTLLGEAQRLLTPEADADAIQTEEQLTPLSPQPFQAYCLMAEAYANLGQYSQATQACQQALQIDPLAIEPYYGLAQIAEEQGDIDRAKLFLKRIVYLAPTAVQAYLELGSIQEREGDIKQAQKTWRSLLQVLQSLPPEKPIDSTNQSTIAELKSYVLQHLN